MHSSTAETGSGKRRLTEIHMIRALAIIAVLVVHGTSETVVWLDKSSTVYPIYNFLNIFFKFGTPTFILLSAFVLFYSYFDREDTVKTIRRFYRRRLKFVVMPYIIFSIVYYALTISVIGFSDWGSLFGQFMRQLATGKAHSHLYFVFISIQFYLLFPVLLLLVKRHPRLLNHAVWFGLAVQWAFVLINHYEWKIEYKGSIFLSYFSFYFVGAWLGVNYKRYLKAMDRGWKYLLLLMWVLFAVLHVQTYHVYRIHGIAYDTKWFEFVWNGHALASALVLFYLAFVIYKKWSRANWIQPLIQLGVSAFGIYLLHPLILFFYRKIVTTSSVWAYHLMVLGGIVIVLGLSWLLVHLTNTRFRHAWVVFGQSNRIDKKSNRPFSRVEEHQQM